MKRKKGKKREKGKKKDKRGKIEVLVWWKFKREIESFTLAHEGEMVRLHTPD